MAIKKTTIKKEIKEVTKVKEIKLTVENPVTVAPIAVAQKPGFDPDLPESKQRWLR